MNKTKRNKHRKHRAGSIAYYIEEVVSYRTKYETTKEIDSRYPPVVAELLLSLLMEVRSLFTALRVLVGSLLGHLLLALVEKLLSLLIS